MMFPPVFLICRHPLPCIIFLLIPLKMPGPSSLLQSSYKLLLCFLSSAGIGARLYAEALRKGKELLQFDGFKGSSGVPLSVGELHGHQLVKRKKGLGNGKRGLFLDDFISYFYAVTPVFIYVCEFLENAH